MSATTYQLPVVGRLAMGGCEFVVRALPWSLSKRVASLAAALEGGDTEAVASVAAAFWARCVAPADGSPAPDVEDVAQSDVMRALNLALGAGKGEGGPDFPAPPTGDGSGG